MNAFTITMAGKLGERQQRTERQADHRRNGGRAEAHQQRQRDDRVERRIAAEHQCERG
jgi:hypothetical protein